MIWDLEEQAEDAISAYLQANLGANMAVYPAFTDSAIQYPSVVVMAESTQPVSTMATEHPQSEMGIALAIQSEAAPLLDGNGKVVTTARDRNSQARDAVIKWIRVKDLAAVVNTNAANRCIFSPLQFAKSTRSTDMRDNRRLLVTIIELYAVVTAKG